jgi:hypothetical protein
MQSLSVEDPVTCAPDAQNNCTGPFPTSREDWIANFTNYPNVAVHHLQTNVPGTVYFAAGYPITEIQGSKVSGSGTITCSTSVDCSWFGGDNTMWVYYTGPNGVATVFDGPWVMTCNPTERQFAHLSDQQSDLCGHDRNRQRNWRNGMVGKLLAQHATVFCDPRSHQTGSVRV